MNSLAENMKENHISFPSVEFIQDIHQIISYTQ